VDLYIHSSISLQGVALSYSSSRTIFTFFKFFTRVFNYNLIDHAAEIVMDDSI
jgi:hypothetical protein